MAQNSHTGATPLRFGRFFKDLERAGKDPNELDKALQRCLKSWGALSPTDRQYVQAYYQRQQVIALRQQNRMFQTALEHLGLLGGEVRDLVDLMHQAARDATEPAHRDLSDADDSDPDIGDPDADDPDAGDPDAGDPSDDDSEGSPDTDEEGDEHEDLDEPEDDHDAE